MPRRARAALRQQGVEFLTPSAAEVAASGIASPPRRASGSPRAASIPAKLLAAVQSHLETFRQAQATASSRPAGGASR